MTTQDIYAWVQMGLHIVIGGGIVVGISRYFGILRRSIDSQKATIEAQAEQMKAQSTVLQDFERLNKMMQQVIAFVDPEAQLKRERAYKERLDRDMKAWQEDLSKQLHDHLSVLEKEFNRLIEETNRPPQEADWALMLEELANRVRQDMPREQICSSPDPEPSTGGRANGGSDAQP